LLARLRRSLLVKVYSGENIRNVAIVGHGHAGKTTLVSAMLYAAGATPRLGRVDDGTSMTDLQQARSCRLDRRCASHAQSQA
ncbi:MAG TPA: GTP-binding protein, partial [Candidatus Aquilonibacter sp.]|nr:GTP-binding protein [Candidatus Aquilonibacter sp.]